MSRLKLAIIGVGLIGGSLGLCLKDKLGEDIYITGLCRHQASMDRASSSGLSTTLLPTSRRSSAMPTSSS